jgi:hypothetical protein
MSNEFALTTIDNPYNPFDDFTLWLLFDKEKGYNTCEYLARTVNLSSDLSEKEMEDEIERAMDEIIKVDPFNIYRKVTEESFKAKSNDDETST